MLTAIRCPNCESPISDDAFVCPYCHSTAPASAPWNKGGWSTVGLLAIGVMVLYFIDSLTGTHFLSTLWNGIQKSS